MSSLIHYDNESSVGYSVLPDNVPKITDENNYDYETIPPLLASNNFNKLPNDVADSFDNIFSALMNVLLIKSPPAARCYG